MANFLFSWFHWITAPRFIIDVILKLNEVNLTSAFTLKELKLQRLKRLAEAKPSKKQEGEGQAEEG